MSVVASIGTWLTDHATVLAAVVSAIAAAIVAWFTIVLARATREMLKAARDQRTELQKAGEIAEKQMLLSGRQTDIIEKQHGLDRLQFIADKRPRLRVRHVTINHPMPEARTRIPLFQEGQRVTGSLVIVNVGATSAEAIDSRYCFYWSNTGLPMDPPLSEESPRLFDGVAAPLEGGESRTIPIESQNLMDTNATNIAFGRGDWHLYVMGMVRYADIGSPPVERFMGFCRVYQLPERGAGEGRFVVVKDPDYEYED